MNIIGKQFNRQDNKITLFLKDDKNNVEVLYFPYTEEIYHLVQTGQIEKIIELKKPKLALKSIFGNIVEDKNKYYLEGTDVPIPHSLVTILLKDYSKNYNIDRLLKFWTKCLKCKNLTAIESLFDFLEVNNMPITDEGNIIAWKRVKTKDKRGLTVPSNLYGINFYAGKVWKGDQEVDKKTEQEYLTWLYEVSKIDLVDCYSGTYINNVGSTVVFNGTPDFNRENVCSSGGLHVANESYARDFYNGRDGILIMVEFSPEDVISCPVDYNSAKLRVFKYKVISIVGE